MNDRPHVLDRFGRDVHAEGALLRAQGPITRIELPGGVLAWSVTGYEAGRKILSDPRFSKNPREHWTAYVNGEIGVDFPLIGWVLMENLTTAHGRDHTRLRKLTASAFTPRRVEGVRPSVQQIADTLLDNLFDPAAPGPADLKARFAQPLAAQVICDLFGVPEQDRAEMLRGYQVNVDTTISPEEAAANVAQWHREMQAFIDSKRANPGDDLTTDLIAARDEGSRLSDAELVDTLHLLLATGTEPVMNLITNAVHVLLQRPDQLELVRSGRVGWAEVIEETLRVEAPVAHLPFRFAVEDVEVDGFVVPKGEPILMNFAAMGRDAERNGADAHEFDVTRTGGEHLSFGHGVYRCIGMPLARMEAEIALSSLFERFPGLTLAVAPDAVAPQGTFIMNGRESLPVHRSQAGAAAA
ncbi:cytochrome P450 family protein [Amycolatopsis sp. NPDC004747]